MHKIGSRGTQTILWIYTIIIACNTYYLSPNQEKNTAPSVVLQTTPMIVCLCSHVPNQAASSCAVYSGTELNGGPGRSTYYRLKIDRYSQPDQTIIALLLFRY